ncbi:MAG: RNA 2',3'-cyclic phosphodiesterase, partial [Deltaproteobacteria bacterium]|nr:RNA 2',3'-cyclic phosphodiesterase [Deltaproteobacteria bacterium]
MNAWNLLNAKNGWEKRQARMSQIHDADSGPQAARLFVALEIPEDVKDALGCLQSGFSGLKWTAASNLHLTLRFIGLVPQARVEQVQQALRLVTSGSFRLVVAGLGLFHRRNGGIVWAGVHNEPSLLKLKRHIDNVLCFSAELSLKEESFSPHLTVSR